MTFLRNLDRGHWCDLISAMGITAISIMDLTKPVFVSW
jgi:hypothetical protein